MSQNYKGIILLPPRHHLPQQKIVTLPTGERVNVTVDDSGTVKQIEHNHTLDAIVRPKTITVRRIRR